MPLVLKNKFDRVVAKMAHQSAMRSTDEIVSQLQARNRELQAQLKAAHEQIAFNAAEYEKQISTLLNDLIRAKYELARNEFAAAPSPSSLVH